MNNINVVPEIVFLLVSLGLAFLDFLIAMRLIGLRLEGQSREKARKIIRVAISVWIIVFFVWKYFSIISTANSYASCLKPVSVAHESF